MALEFARAKLGLYSAGEQFRKNISDYNAASNNNYGKFDESGRSGTLQDQIQQNQLKKKALELQIHAKTLGAAQTSLRSILNLPGFDVVGDPANAFLSLAEGDYANATSYGIASVIPGISGMELRAGKFLGKEMTKGISKGLGKESVEETVTLYRSVGMDEFVDVIKTRQFNTKLGQVEGKYFSSTFDEAVMEGTKNYSSHSEKFTMLSVEIPKSLYEKLVEKLPHTDNFMPGKSMSDVHFVPLKNLDEFNKSYKQIEVLGVPSK